MKMSCLPRAYRKWAGISCSRPDPCDFLSEETMDRADAEMDWTQIPEDESHLEPDWEEMESDTIVNTSDTPQDSGTDLSTTIPGMMTHGQEVPAHTIDPKPWTGNGL